jgi:hypothetical protein
MNVAAWASPKVLVVADEIPAMEVLAQKLKARENVSSLIVTQAAMPKTLAGFDAVIVYIHLGLNAAAEDAFIDYTKAGGKLIVLHHSISSGKRKNKHWFEFLGVALPEGAVDQGGYKWIERVTLDFANLAPGHFITTNRVEYPDRIPFAIDGVSAALGTPGFTLEDSEVYINHRFTEPRAAVLLGMRYPHAPAAKTYCQATGGWIKSAGKGWIIYLMPGHSVKDFENAAYARILANAVIWQP